MDPDLWRNGRYFLLFDVADLVLVIVGDDASPLPSKGISFKLILRRNTSISRSKTYHIELSRIHAVKSFLDHMK